MSPPFHLPKRYSKLYSASVGKLFWIFITLSILVHLSGYWGSSQLPIRRLGIYPKKPVYEIDLFENKSKTSKDIKSAPIRFTEAPQELKDDNLENLKKKADILSERTQRVKKEMIANLIGMSKNRWQGKLRKDSRKVKVENSKKDSSFKVFSDYNGGINISEKSQGGQVEQLDPGLSTFGNQLNKKIDVGNFTALNTDYHLYASFYSRIEDLIRPTWEDKAKEESRKINNNELLRPKGGWSTRIDVILDPSGKLIKVVLLKSSGIKAFDEAAQMAIVKAGFFPHPPEGMIKDNQIVLKYSFTIY